MADDPRDDELAAQLAVEPLDDVTRRRLVHRALAESTPEDPAVPTTRGDRSLPTRLVAAAAVFLVLAVGVVALLTMSDNGNDATVAGRKADQASRATPQAGSGSAAEQLVPESAADQGASSTAGAPAADASQLGGATNLGDLGDLSSAAARRRLLTTIDTAVLAAPVDADSGVVLGFLPCPPINVSSLVAYATGTVNGRPAGVVVNERADGSKRVRLLTSNPCEVRQLR